MKDFLRRTAVVIIALVTICPCISSAAPSAENVTGEHIWLGVLKVPNAELRMVIEIFRKADGNLTAALSSPDQGAYGIPVDEFSLADGTARFVIKAANLVIEGPINDKDMTIDAQFKQGSESLPLPLKIVEEVPSRPPRKQDPVKPYPYIEEAVVFDNPEGGVKLSGTLTIPRTQGVHPAVLLVAGSGPNDRNGTSYGHFWLLADYLTRNGFAVLRYDKRGIMRSTGNYRSATTTDFAGDALAGVRYLMRHSDIDHGAVGMIGHSEGAFIVAQVASESPDVAFIVMLGGTGINHYDLEVLQDCAEIGQSKGLGDADIAVIRSWSQRFYAIAKDEKDDAVAEKKMRDMYANMTDDEKRLIGENEWNMGWTLQAKNAISPWFREFIAGDPQPILRKVTCPTLALTGSKDVQCPPKENLKGIEESLKAGGNTRYTVIEMPDLNHLFQTATTGSPDEYSKLEETIAPSALDTIAQWLTGQTGKYVSSK
ncbi:alpha/beta fold hydrolase [bacterium]|nr:alpha/beta fold hydrolase [bacterium]